MMCHTAVLHGVALYWVVLGSVIGGCVHVLFKHVDGLSLCGAAHLPPAAPARVLHVCPTCVFCLVCEGSAALCLLVCTPVRASTV